jgi:hypothetical protein
MEKRSEFRSTDTQEINIPAIYTEKSTDFVLRKLRSCLAANLIVFGVSGKEYHFPMAGAEVNVDKEDYDQLLARVIKNSSCCGGGASERPLFEAVK